MFLWTKGNTPAPVAYIRQRFYKEFGWTPKQLREQRAEDILEIMAVWEVEGKIEQVRKRGKSA